MSEWYTNEGKDSDVVLSTKACIVRNIKGYNFMPRLDDKECQSLLETVDKVIDKNIYSGGNAADFDKNTVLKLTRLQKRIRWLIPTEKLSTITMMSAFLLQ